MKVIILSWGGIVGAALLSGCATMPTTVRQEAIELVALKAAVECEFAAVLRGRESAGWKLSDWAAKSTLDLTVVQTVGADGKVAWVIPAVAAIRLSPTLGGSRKDTSIAHLEFSTALKRAQKEADPACVGTDDPSQTGLGLAAWIDATLLAFSDAKALHRGLSYTAEFEITLNAEARFGYVVTNVDADIGGGITRIGTNRISVAMAPPSGEPDAIPVYEVQDPHVPAAPAGNGARKGVPPGAFVEKFELPQPARRRQRPSSEDNSAVNRMLILRAPVRIER